MSKRVLSLLTVLFILAGMLTACVPPAPTQAPVAQAPAPEPTAVPPAQAPEPPKAPEPTAAAEAPNAPEPTRLILATTTSTADSGLLGFILPDFEQKFNAKVDVIAVGTGQAIEIGSKGDADVLLVHSRKAEDKFVADGFAKERFDVMYNDFIIVGPQEDPAKIAGMAKAKEAFQAIADASALFVSRGDKSGTDNKEKSIWASIPITPTAEMKWYNSIGQGMGDTLLFTNEAKGYTLTDRGTYLSMRDKLPGLTILVGGENLAENKDKLLLNPYGVLPINPEKFPNVKADLANAFAEWITSVETQEVIADFGVAEFGQPLFYPSSAAYLAAQTPAAALKITGKVGKELGWTEAEVKAMKTLDVQSTNSKGETATYTGVLISDLLALAAPAADAQALEFVADDGFVAEAPLADVLACKDCIVSFRSNGGFSTVLPGFAKNLQVKGVVEIKVK